MEFEDDGAQPVPTIICQHTLSLSFYSSTPRHGDKEVHSPPVPPVPAVPGVPAVPAVPADPGVPSTPGLPGVPITSQQELIHFCIAGSYQLILKYHWFLD